MDRIDALASVGFDRTRPAAERVAALGELLERGFGPPANPDAWMLPWLDAAAIAGVVVSVGFMWLAVAP